MDFELLGRRPNRQTLFTNGILRYSDRAPLSTSFSDFLKQFSCFKPTNRGVEGGARLVKRGGARLVKRFQSLFLRLEVRVLVEIWVVGSLVKNVTSA